MERRRVHNVLAVAPVWSVVLVLGDFETPRLERTSGGTGFTLRVRVSDLPGRSGPRRKRETMRLCGLGVRRPPSARARAPPLQHRRETSPPERPRELSDTRSARTVPRNPNTRRTRLPIDLRWYRSASASFSKAMRVSRSSTTESRGRRRSIHLVGEVDTGDQRFTMAAARPTDMRGLCLYIPGKKGPDSVTKGLAVFMVPERPKSDWIPLSQGWDRQQLIACKISTMSL